MLAINTTESVHVLVVSREPFALSSVWSMGKANSWRIEAADSGWEALEQLQSGKPADLVLLDLAQGESDGLHTLRWLRRIRPELPVVLLSRSGEPQQKAEAIRLGARDYLVHPVAEQQLRLAIERHLPSAESNLNEVAVEDVEEIGEDRFFVASSPVMRQLREQAQLLAQVNAPVLIVGEDGTGKETMARLIHKLSVRSAFPFFKLNCAALSGDLLENELFGSERVGLRSGRAKSGKLELCEQGTILLDNIADMPAEVQVKLLRVLQEKQLVRVGNEMPIPVDTRIIATGGPDIVEALAEKRLREDLYYSLSVFTVHMPPLHQRRDEIPLLLGHFMNQLARHYGLPSRSFSAEALEACQSYSWPGNLRELHSFVKRYLVSGDAGPALAEGAHQDEMIPGHAHISQTSDSSLGLHESEPQSSGLKSLVQSVKGEAERNVIASVLEQTHWNRKAAARLLKVSYRTLLYKIQQYHMTPPGYYAHRVNGNDLKNSNGNNR